MIWAINFNLSVEQGNESLENMGLKYVCLTHKFYLIDVQNNTSDLPANAVTIITSDTTTSMYINKKRCLSFFFFFFPSLWKPLVKESNSNG